MATGERLMTIWWYTLGSTFLISLIALVGILSLYLSADRVREWLLPMVGFAAGALLGNVFLHLLPELVERKGSFDPVSSLLVLLGIVVFFEGGDPRQADTDRGDHMALAHLRPRPSIWSRLGAPTAHMPPSAWKRSAPQLYRRPIGRRFFDPADPTRWWRSMRCRRSWGIMPSWCMRG